MNSHDTFRERTLTPWAVASTKVIGGPRMSRKGSNIERYSTVPTLAPQSIGVKTKWSRGDTPVTSNGPEESRPFKNDAPPQPVPSTTILSLGVSSPPRSPRVSVQAKPPRTDVSASSKSFSVRNSGYGRGRVIGFDRVGGSSPASSVAALPPPSFHPCRIRCRNRLWRRHRRHRLRVTSGPSSYTTDATPSRLRRAVFRCESFSRHLLRRRGRLSPCPRLRAAERDVRRLRRGITTEEGRRTLERIGMDSVRTCRHHHLQEQRDRNRQGQRSPCCINLPHRNRKHRCFTVSVRKPRRKRTVRMSVARLWPCQRNTVLHDVGFVVCTSVYTRQLVRRI